MEKNSKILECTCEHKYQDEKYGPHKRVHNFTIAANSKRGGWRCTVCGKTK